MERVTKLNAVQFNGLKPSFQAKPKPEPAPLQKEKRNKILQKSLIALGVIGVAGIALYKTNKQKSEILKNKIEEIYSLKREISKNKLQGRGKITYLTALYNKYTDAKSTNDEKQIQTAKNAFINYINRTLEQNSNKDDKKVEELFRSIKDIIEH